MQAIDIRQAVLHPEKPKRVVRETVTKLFLATYQN